MCSSFDPSHHSASSIYSSLYSRSFLLNDSLSQLLNSILTPLSIPYPSRFHDIPTQLRFSFLPLRFSPAHFPSRGVASTIESPLHLPRVLIYAKHISIPFYFCTSLQSKPWRCSECVFPFATYSPFFHFRIHCLKTIFLRPHYRFSSPRHIVVDFFFFF